MLETIRCDIENQIMIVTLSRPERLNAFNKKMLDELLQTLDDAEENNDVRTIIVTGEGRGFCAGADLEKGEKTFEKSESTMEAYRDTGGILALRIFELKKPIIAAINGPAVGVGITMTLPMDIRIASTDAKMGFVFARRGIVPEACSGWFLPRVVGIGKAIEWVMTGKILSSHEAYECGLVNEVVKPEELLPKAKAIASDIAEYTSATSIALSRQLLWRMLGADHPKESHIIESKLLHWIGKQPDAKEGVKSFLEKRKPNFIMNVNNDMPPFFPWWEEK